MWTYRAENPYLIICTSCDLCVFVSLQGIDVQPGVGVGLVPGRGGPAPQHRDVQPPRPVAGHHRVLRLVLQRPGAGRPVHTRHHQPADLPFRKHLTKDQASTTYLAVATVVAVSTPAATSSRKMAPLSAVANRPTKWSNWTWPDECKIQNVLCKTDLTRTLPVNPLEPELGGPGGVGGLDGGGEVQPRQPVLCQ